MRICLDVTPLIQPVMTGVHIVTRDVTQQLLIDFPQEQWVLFAVAPRAALNRLEKIWEASDERVEKKFISVPARLFHRGMPWWQYLGWPPVEVWAGKIDHYHSFEWFHAPSMAPSSATLQDWSPMRHPEWYAADNVRVFRQRWQAVAKRAQTIVTVSHFLEDELKAFNPQFHHIQAIPNGIPVDCQIPPQPIIRAALKHFGLLPGFMLAVGTLGERKNYQTLLKAYRDYRSVSKKPKQLVIVAQLRNEENNLELKQAGLVVIQDHTREELMALYAQAAALLFPSWYEAYGLPMLEAMQCGCPVIASDIPTAHELGGSLFHYVGAGDVKGWIAAMKEIERVETNDNETISTLKKRADRYNLKTVAGLYHGVFMNKLTRKRESTL